MGLTYLKNVTENGVCDNKNTLANGPEKVVLAT